MGQRIVTRTRQALLADLIDYAGLFPPAALSMTDAIARYAGYRRGSHAWMLGRFIVPRVRLDELEPLVPPVGTDAPWRLSALLSDDLASDGAAIAAFNARLVGRAEIDTVEITVASAEDVRRSADALAPLQLWCEIAPGTDADPMLDALAAAGPQAGAKIRTGGTTPDAIPTVDRVAAFLLACARHGVPWKATAGLHHPLRAPHRLTYADDSPTAVMHGFVNVFLAGVLAYASEAAAVGPVVALLGEGDARRIAWDADEVRWSDWHFTDMEIARVRAHFARSFGSCSFDEPIEDLIRLGWL